MEKIIELVRKCLNSYFNISESSDAYGHYFYYDSEFTTLDNHCLFDQLLEVDKRILLQCYFERKNMQLNLGWNVNVELAKLAAKEGHLIRKEAESFLDDETLQNHWNDCFLRIAYWGSSSKYETKLIDLINEKKETYGMGYDGMFIAVWFMNSTSVDQALAKVITNWLSDNKLDTASCSLEDIGRLIKRWGEMKGLTGHRHLQNLYESLVSKDSTEVKTC